MLVIRVTFADGATEDREDDSPCIANVFEPVLKHPSEERWYLWFPDASRPLSFCARDVIPLTAWRGGGALVWRITSAPDEPLAGQWAECRVETCEEQIARLTAENARLLAWASALVDRSDDAACRRVDLILQAGTEKARADAAEKRIADLRAWALKERGAVRDRGAAEAARGEDLAAAWCDGEAAALGELLQYIDGFPLREAVEWAVARIDGKDGESK